MENLRKAIDSAQVDGAVMALLFLDLEEFRNFKYTFGHIFSDALLFEVGARLNTILRPDDFLARLGYGEFAFVLHDVADIGDVRKMAGEISVALSTPFVLAGGRRQSVRASIGVSMYPRDAQNGEILLQRADIAMYAARAGGKGDYLFYERRMSTAILEKFIFEQALRDGLARKEFVVYYQPRVDCHTGELCAVEALARWNHAERGLLEPSEFIPVAEASGLIVQLGDQIIEMVCQQLAEWKQRGLPAIPVSINVSPHQLNRSDLKARILLHTSTHCVDPALLEIEVTESCLIEYDQGVKQQLRALSKLGLKLLLDDFGTGYSSLSQLQQFEMDVLKVDRSFTANLQTEHHGKALVSAIISMAHALDMKVAVEGVETPEQLRLLQTLSCDEVQGYLVSRPVPADAMAALMCKTTLFGDEMSAMVWAGSQGLQCQDRCHVI